MPWSFIYVLSLYSSPCFVLSVCVASVFGEQSKLEPMSQKRKERWRKEIDWLLSVTDYIVEFVPAQQKAKDGTNMEVLFQSCPPYIYASRIKERNVIPVLTDNGYSTKKRSGHEHPCSEEA